MIEPAKDYADFHDDTCMGLDTCATCRANMPMVERGFRRVDDPDDPHYTLDGSRVWSVTELVTSYGHAKPLDEFQQAMAREGTARHKWIEIMLKGELDKYANPGSFAQVIIARAMAVLDFIGFHSAEGVEESGYCEPPNSPIVYAGTIDLRARLKDGSRALVDWKGSARDKSHRVRLALYRRIFQADLSLIVYLTAPPGVEWKPETAVEVFDDPADDAEADRVLNSAAWRARRVPRKTWPVKAGKNEAPF